MNAAKTQAESTATVSHSYHFFKMPDLNRATHRALGQSGAGWTFETICRLLHHVGRVGRPQARKAARELGRLGVGLQAIADEAGISVAKVRRDLVTLVDLGLVAVSRRNVQIKLDPATGKIVENRTGRSLPTLVFLTVGPEHGRTKAGTDRPAANPTNQAPTNPATVVGTGTPHKDHPGGGRQRERNTKRTPDGDAVGIGTPPACQEAGLPAGEQQATEQAIGRENATQSRLPADEATGLTAGKAVHEGEGDLDGEPVPIGRVSLPAGRTQKARKTKAVGDQPVPIEDRVWNGTDAERIEATRRREQAELAALASEADGRGMKGGSFLEEFRAAVERQERQRRSQEAAA